MAPGKADNFVGWIALLGYALICGLLALTAAGL